MAYRKHRGIPPLALCLFSVLAVFLASQGQLRSSPGTTVHAQAETIVYVTKTGSKYHRAGCRSLSKSAIPMSLKEAVAKGYGPCSICKPPTLSSAPATSTPPRTLSTETAKASGASRGEAIVYVTKTGKKYHRAGCSGLAKSSIAMSLKEAVTKGYTPCSVCKPPFLEAEPEAIPPAAMATSAARTQGAGDVIVYVTKTGTKYHQAGCRSLSKSAIPMSLKDAVAKGYGPCSVCKPPVFGGK